jgi:hypothetical protein
MPLLDKVLKDANLKAVKLIDAADIQSKIQPKSHRPITVPAVSRYRASPNIGQVHPILISIVLPNVNVAIHTEADTARIDGLGGNAQCFLRRE